MTTLEQLAASKEAHVALLASAQLWRTRVVTATADDVTQWRERLERMPSELRAGPYFLVGQALARLGQPQESAIAFMRVAILYPEQRQLSAEALTQAGRQLQSLGETKQAAALFREVLLKFADTPSAAVAQARLDALTGE
jgi:TolA-binding protein